MFACSCRALRSAQARTNAACSFDADMSCGTSGVGLRQLAPVSPCCNKVKCALVSMAGGFSRGVPTSRLVWLGQQFVEGVLSASTSSRTANRDVDLFTEYAEWLTYKVAKRVRTWL